MHIDKPRFELKSIYNDGSAKEPQIVPINEMPLDTNTNRRGFLGAGLVAGVALTLLGKSNLFARPTSNTNPDKHFEDKELYAHCNFINALSLSPDGNILISGSNQEDTIKLWSFSERKLLKTLLGYPLADNSFLITPDGKILALKTGKDVELLSLPSGISLKILKGHTDRIKSLCISPDGKILASGSIDKTIKLWNLPDGNLLKTTDGLNEWAKSLCFSPDNKILASGEFFKNTIRLWSLPEGDLLKTIEGKANYLRLLSFSPDGKILASGENNGNSFLHTIKLWSLPDGNLLKTIKGLNESIFSLSFSPDGKILVSGLYENIQLWSLTEGKLLNTLKGHTKLINVLSMSPDGTILASGSEDRTIKLWSLPEGELIKTLEGHSSFVTSLCFSTNGKVLASGSFDKTIRLWDLEKKEFIGFLFDAACNETKGVTYNVYDKITGTTQTYTLPCGSPIPAGATCTCNCVAGTYKPPTYSPSSICTCNQVCTCVPICQAHKLLHPDKVIRSLSKEILLFMGISEIEYMQWAADNSKKRLKAVITSLIKKIKRGANPDYQSWPSIAECEKYLMHDDEVVSVMAAQMINLQSHLVHQIIPEDLSLKIDTLLLRSESMHWSKKV